MFRPMRRKNQEVGLSECEKVLTLAKRGILALNGDGGYPYAIPMDFFYEEGKIYFHTAKSGHKIDAVRNDPRVSFCVMDEGYRNEGEWFWNVTSVVAFGKAEIVEDKERKADMLRKLGNKYFPSHEMTEEELPKGIDGVWCIELTVEHMTGKLVAER